MAASDLVQDSELETTILPNCVQHTFYRRGESAKNRRVKVVEQWVRLRHLGSGSFGTVWLEQCAKPARSDTPQIRAVKEIKTGPNSNMDYNRELEAIAKFSHIRYIPCFVRSYGWYRTSDTISITMEYLPYGDLQQYLISRLSEDEARTIAKQILDGLVYMHQNKFAHRDLKPQNILVVSPGPDWLVQITDFGISKRLQEDSSFRPTIGQGTLKFMAPEMLGMVSEKRYPYAVDIWSLGVIGFFLLANTFPFEDLDHLGQYARGVAQFGEEKLIALEVSLTAAHFLKSLLSPNPQSRPSALDARSHEWMATASSLAPGNADPDAEVVVLEQNMLEEMAKGHDEYEALLQDTASWDTNVPPTTTSSEQLKQAPPQGPLTILERRPIKNQTIVDNQHGSARNVISSSDPRPGDMSRIADPQATASWSSPNSTLMSDSVHADAGLSLRNANSTSLQSAYPPAEPVVSPLPRIRHRAVDTTPSPSPDSRIHSMSTELKVHHETDRERDLRPPPLSEDGFRRRKTPDDANKPLSGARLPTNFNPHRVASPRQPLQPPSKGIRDIFSRIVGKNRPAKSTPERISDAYQKATPYDGDPYSRELVEPKDVRLLIELCTSDLKARGLDQPFPLLPFRPGSNQRAVRSIVRSALSEQGAMGFRRTQLHRELQISETPVVAGVLKWCWSRLRGGVVGWDAYELFKVGEQDANMAWDSFKTFVPLTVDTEDSSAIIFGFFDLLSAIAAHRISNGMGGRKLSRMAAWWAFEPRSADRGFDDAYQSWLKAADATSHMFFAYLRSMSGKKAQGPISAIAMLPLSLEKLLEETEYPPKRPASTQSAVYKITMLVDAPSPTPFSLIKRSSHFKYRDEETALQSWSEYEDKVYALTEECHRILKAMSTPLAELTSNSGSSSAWLDMMDFSSGGDSADTNEPFAQTRRPPGSQSGLSRPTTPSWADFLASGYANAALDGPLNLLLPPDKILPPIKTSNSPKQALEDDSVLEPGELASVFQFELDDAFWWVWMSSNGPEETPERKSAFGRSLVLETVIYKYPQTCLVLEEVVRGESKVAPEAGAYIVDRSGPGTIFKRKGRR